jgi:hypothetical protein
MRKANCYCLLFTDIRHQASGSRYLKSRHAKAWSLLRYDIPHPASRIAHRASRHLYRLNLILRNNTLENQRHNCI